MSTSSFRLCYDNFAAAAATTVTALSALVSFPISNAFHQYRSLRYKTGGAFTITAANQAFYINDGSDKSFNVTAGVYATGAALAAEIQVRLLITGANWTCTYSTTTGLFTIARSSGTKILRLSVTTNAVWDTIGFVGAINQNASAADARRNHTNERISIDLGSARDCKCFFVYGDADQQFTISDTATVVLKASSLNDYDTAPLSVALTVGTLGIFKFIDALSVSTEYRYWWLDFIDRENPAGPESFSLKIWLGDFITPVNRNIGNGFRTNIIDPSVVRVSSNGTRYSSVKTKYMSISGVEMLWVNGTDRTDINAAFRVCGTTVPLFISIDPEANISSGVQELTKLVVFDSNPDHSHLRFDYFGFNMSFSEVVG